MNPLPLLIFAASSLSNVLPDIAKEFNAQNKEAPSITFSFDASSKLAKQIESGAPADLFFSADSDWMDYLDQKDKIVKNTRTNLLSNKIVLIVPADAKNNPKNPKDLIQNTYAHIALAGEAVPAGKFARAALKAEGILNEEFNKKIVNADNVRTALGWVAKHEADAGVVYSTDAKIEPQVKVAFAFKDGTYPKVIYPAGVVQKANASPYTEKFIKFCKSEFARKKFKDAGFIVL